MGLRILPVFAIELHVRDLGVLKRIKEFFSVGSVTVRTRNGKPTGIYSVQSLKDLTEVIIPHFKEYPLLTQKQADFILFSSLIILMNNKEHLTEKGINKLLCIVLNITENRVNCMKLLYQLGVRQYAAKYKSISYYNKLIVTVKYIIGFIKVQRLVSEFYRQ